VRRVALPLFALLVAQRGAPAAPAQTAPDEHRTFADAIYQRIGAGFAAARDALGRPAPTVDLVGFQVGLRDLVHRSALALADWNAAAGAAAALGAPNPPDLTVLRASPVPDVESSGFGWRDDPLHHRRKFHKGTDFRADRGTPVHAAGDGVVVFTGWQRGYGRTIYIDHGGGVVTRYAHLAKIEAALGTAVVAATRIGQVGASGRATGPHLHFEVRLDGRAVDPVLAMQIAEVQASSPDLARALAMMLDPEVQSRSLDGQDATNRRRARSKALW
jgi:murein DD-endopeptidase MepM/ murein hydrolase activator NlpD